MILCTQKIEFYHIGFSTEYLWYFLYDTFFIKRVWSWPKMTILTSIYDQSFQRGLIHLLETIVSILMHRN